MKKLWFNSLLLVTCISFGMEKEPVQGFMPSALLMKMGQSSTSALFGPSIACHIIVAIDEVPKDGYIGIDMQYLTDDNIIQALVEAKKRGVELQITMRDDNENNNQQTVYWLGKENILSRWSKNNHCKRVLLSALKPYNINIYNQAKLKPHCIVFEGSYNGSRLAPNHQEIMVKTLGDPDYFMQHYRDHQNVMQWTYSTNMTQPQLTRMPSKINVQDVTEHKTVINSYNTHDWLESLANVIDTLQAADEIDITTMTIDHLALLVILKEASKKGVVVRLFIDREAVKDKDTEIIKKLLRIANAGGSVFVYNPLGIQMASIHYPSLLHAKTINILSKKYNKLLTIISSGNFTGHSLSEINHISYHPDNQSLYNQVKGLCSKLLPSSIPLQEYINRPQGVEPTESESGSPPAKKRRFE